VDSASPAPSKVIVVRFIIVSSSKSLRWRF
jgi:hypothetical protein